MFGGFGSTQQQPAFGAPAAQPAFGAAAQPAFGAQATAAAPSAFGAPAPAATGFGAAPAFGAAPTTTGFGAGSTFGGGGFGATAAAAPSAFGAARPPAFGAATTTGFGAAPTSTFGGFGTPATQPSGFGATSTGFGAPATTAPAFGSGGASAFGSSTLGGGTTSAFGAGTGASMFGSATSSFGAPGQTNSNSNCGTGNPIFAATQERESGQNGVQTQLLFQSISAMPNYKTWSFEELRFQDYSMNKKFSSTSGPTGAFGTSTQSAFGTTGTFGQTAGTGSGLFGKAPAFGASTTGFGGATTGTGFGATNTGTPSAFGATGATSGFGAPTGAFGAPTTAGFGATGTGAFGANAPKPFSSFPASGTSSFGTSAFGTANNTPTTSIFGAPKTTTPFGAATTQPTQQTGFGFGTGLLGGTTAGAQPAGTTGMFGQPAATPFGAQQQQQPAATPFGGGSLFGATPAPASTSLFSNTNTTQNNLFNAPKTGGFFGAAGAAATPAQGSGPGLFSTPFGGSTGFSSNFSTPATGFGSSLGAGGSLFPSSQPAAQPGPTLQASIDKSPYGNNPLFDSLPASLTAVGSARAPKIYSASVSDTKKPAMLPHYKVTPKSASKIKLRGFASSPTLKDSSPSLRDSSSPRSADSNAIAAAVASSLAGDRDNRTGGFPESFRPRVKKLILTEDSTSFQATPGPRSAGTADLNSTPASTKSVRFVDDPAFAGSASKVVDVTSEDVPTIRESPRGDFASSTGGAASSSVARPSPGRSSSPRSPSTKPAAYITSPSMEELMELSDEALSNLEGFSVMLPGVGHIRFLEPVNLLEASPTGDRRGIPDILGKVIVFRPKVIEVYPDEDTKDPVGAGVNVPAEVQLEKCWVIDKATGDIIEDRTDPRFDRHFKKLESAEGTRMLGFNPKTGAWKFRVDHFSKYGLDDDDDDDEEQLPSNGSGPRGPNAAASPYIQGDDDEYEDDEDDMDEDEDDDRDAPPAMLLGADESYEADENDETFRLDEDSFANLRSRRHTAVAPVRDLRSAVPPQPRSSQPDPQRQQKERQQDDRSQQQRRRPARPASRLQNVFSADDSSEDPDDDVETPGSSSVLEGLSEAASPSGTATPGSAIGVGRRRPRQDSATPTKAATPQQPPLTAASAKSDQRRRQAMRAALFDSPRRGLDSAVAPPALAAPDDDYDYDEAPTPLMGAVAGFGAAASGAAAAALVVPVARLLPSSGTPAKRARTTGFEASSSTAASTPSRQPGISATKSPAGGGEYAADDEDEVAMDDADDAGPALRRSLDFKTLSAAAAAAAKSPPRTLARPAAVSSAAPAAAYVPAHLAATATATSASAAQPSATSDDGTGLSGIPQARPYASLGSAAGALLAELPGLPAPPAFEQSLAFARQRLCVDAGLAMARSFRVGWGPSGAFAAPACGR